MNINNCYIGKITQLVDEDMYETRSIYPYMYCITNQSQIIRTYTKREDITKHKEEFLHVTLNPNMWDDCYLRLTHVKKIEFDDGWLPCLDIKYDNTDDNEIFDYHLYNKQEIYNFINKCNRDASGLEEAKDKFLMHHGKSCGDNLYSLKDNNYPTFISLLHDIKTNSLANKTEKDILIKINYFSEFGDITKLLYLNELYEKYGTRKTFKKKELSDDCPITTDLLIRFSDKETDKQYSGVDMISLLSYLEQYLERNNETSKLDHMCYEVALLGYTNITDEFLEENYAIVSNTDSNKYDTIFLSLYSPKYGVVEQYKVDKKWYYQFSCDIGDLLRVNITENYKRTKNNDGEWVKSDDTELKIQSYYIIKKFDK